MKSIIFQIILFSAYLRIDAQVMDKSALDKIWSAVFSATRNTNSSGGAITILQNGNTIMKHQWGMANLEHQIPFTHHTPVRLTYSEAREFICAGLAMMEIEGLLQLDDKVRDYFPNLPAWSNQITIQDLLNHRSGFDDEWGTMLLMQASMHNRVDKEQLLSMLYNQPLPQVKPGEGYMYSNSDLALIRFIMEQVSAMSLPKYLEEKIFRPLQMSSTLMNDNLEQLIPGLAENYYGKSKFYKQRNVKTSPGGNYRIITTGSDLEKWAAALEDSTSIISQAFGRLYRKARPIPVISPQVHYVFGHEWEQFETAEVIKHGGVNDNFYMARIPSRNLVIILLDNGSGDIITVQDVLNALLKNTAQNEMEAPVISGQSISLTNQEINNFAGRYFELDRYSYSSAIPLIVFYDLKKEGDNLNFYYAKDAYFTMIPAGPNRFKDPESGEIFEFSGARADSITHMQIHLADGDTLHFRKYDPPSGYSPQDLKRFTGEYYSEHLDFYCRIILSPQNELIIRRPTVSDKLLIPYDQNRFIFEMQADRDGWYVMAEFTQNNKGEIEGINLQHQRMMHHRFKKVR